MIRRFVSYSVAFHLALLCSCDAFATDPGGNGLQQSVYTRGGWSGGIQDSLQDNIERGAVIPTAAYTGNIAWDDGHGQYGLPTEIGSQTGFNPDDFSIISIGQIYIPQAGPVCFRDGTDDYQFLSIDGQVLIRDNDWASFDGTANGGSPVGVFNAPAPGWYGIVSVTTEGGFAANGVLYSSIDYGEGTNKGNPAFSDTGLLGPGAVVPINYLSLLPGLLPIIQAYDGAGNTYYRPDALSAWGNGGRGLTLDGWTNTKNSDHLIRGSITANNWSVGDKNKSYQETVFDTPTGEAGTEGAPELYRIHASDNTENSGLDIHLNMNVGGPTDDSGSFAQIGQDFSHPRQGIGAAFKIASLDGSPVTGEIQARLDYLVNAEANFWLPVDYNRAENNSEPSYEIRNELVWANQLDTDLDGVPDNLIEPINFGRVFQAVQDGSDVDRITNGFTGGVIATRTSEVFDNMTVNKSTFSRVESVQFTINTANLQKDADGNPVFGFLSNLTASSDIPKDIDILRVGSSGNSESGISLNAIVSWSIISAHSDTIITLVDGSLVGEPPPPPELLLGDFDCDGELTGNDWWLAHALFPVISDRNLFPGDVELERRAQLIWDNSEVLLGKTREELYDLADIDRNGFPDPFYGQGWRNDGLYSGVGDPDGQFVSNFNHRLNEIRYHRFRSLPNPEPGSVLLMALGLGLLFTATRHRIPV